MKEIKPIDVRQMIQNCISEGNHLSDLPTPKPAFDVWWEETFGKKTKGKQIAQMAWYEALRQMGCN